MKPAHPITILIADDDEEDRMLMKEALEESHLANDLRFVEDGQALMDYLQRRGDYAGLDHVPVPGIILLDLKMPRKDGFEVIQEVKSDPSLRMIPIVVLTTSKTDEDIYRTYDLGVNSFITKPVTFEALLEVTQTLTRYWFQIVEVPHQHVGA